MFHSYLKVLPRYPFLLYLFILSSLYISIPTYVLSCSCVSLSSYLCVATPYFSFLSPYASTYSTVFVLYIPLSPHFSISELFQPYAPPFLFFLYVFDQRFLTPFTFFTSLSYFHLFFFLFILSSVLYASFITFLVTFITFV